MQTKTPKPDDQPKLAVRLFPEDRERLRELRALLAGEISEPSDSDVVRWALKEAHKARVENRQ